MTGTGTTTGSWAESTHSVIWLTRGGNRLPLARVGRRSWGTNLISVAVIALTSLIAASNLLDVYGSAAMWAVAAVPATLLGALIALCRDRTRAAPVVADRVPDRCAGRHRPGHRAERHRHQPCDSLCGNAVTGVRQHLRRVQIPYRHTAADRFRRWQPDGGMDDMPMAVIPRRRVRHRRQTAAQRAEPAADRHRLVVCALLARRPVSSP